MSRPLGFHGLRSGDSISIGKWSWVTLNARTVQVFVGATSADAQQQQFAIRPGVQVVLGYVAPGSVIHVFSYLKDLPVIGISVQEIPPPGPG